MTTEPSDRSGPDERVKRTFLVEVLDKYPGNDLVGAREGVGVRHVSRVMLSTFPNWQTDRAFYTYGRWCGFISVDGYESWAYWHVFDDDDADEEAEDRGRFVALFESEAEAVEYFIDDLVDVCDFFERPAPEEWPDDEGERAWQEKRLVEYVERKTPYWRELTGFPDDVIAYCIRERLDARETWKVTLGHPTQDHVDAYRMLAGLTQ